VVRYNSTNSMNGSICVASQGTISTGTITGSPFCAGSSISVPFTSYGVYGAGNLYRAQLSDASGSFASPTNIGSIASTANSGSISAAIPAGTAYGTSYRIRVTSNTPAVTGSDNGTNITINALPQGVFSGNTLCGSGTGELTFTASAGSGPFTVEYYDGISNRTQNNVVSGTPFTPFLTPVITTNYTLVSVTDNNGCLRNTGFTDGAATIAISTTPHKQFFNSGHCMLKQQFSKLNYHIQFNNRLAHAIFSYLGWNSDCSRACQYGHYCCYIKPAKCSCCRWCFARNL
jgi:hypothetical protein